MARRKQRHISVLQFDRRLISRLRVRRTPEGLEVLAFDEIRGPFAEEAGGLAAALKEFVAAHEIAEDSLFTVLHRHEMTTRILNLPSQDPAEIEGMVRLSAEEFVPFSADELIVEQCILKRLPGGESQVLGVFTHRDVVESHVALLREAGVEPEQIFLSSACLASAARAARKPDQGRFALVNLSSGGLEALVFDESGNFVFSRGVATEQDWALTEGDAEAVLEELAIEVRGTLAAYRRESEDGQGADTVYLSSDWADPGAAAARLGDETGKEVAPATFALEIVSAGRERLGGAVPLAAIGAALTAQGRGSLHVSLLPDWVLARRATAALQGHLLRGAALAAVLLAAVAGLYFQAVHQRTQLIDELERRLAALRPQAEGVSAKRQQLQILKREVEESRSVLEYLAALSRQAPEEGLNVISYTFHRERGIDITGRARTRDDIRRFLDNVRGVAGRTLEQFAQATREYENEARERNEAIFEYKIAVPFIEESRDEDEAVERF